MRKSIIGSSLLIFAIALLMIIAPEAWLKVTVIILGLFALANGAYNLIHVRSLIEGASYKKIVTIRAITSIIVGFAAISLPLLFVEIVWTVMVYIMATYLILSAIAELISASKLKEVGISQKVITTEIIASFVLAIILFILAGEIAYIFIRVIGIILLLFSISLAVWEWKNRSLKIEVEEVE